jgi:hypothetical protein
MKAGIVALDTFLLSLALTVQSETNPCCRSPTCDTAHIVHVSPDADYDRYGTGQEMIIWKMLVVR